MKISLKLIKILENINCQIKFNFTFKIISFHRILRVFKFPCSCYLQRSFWHIRCWFEWLHPGFWAWKQRPLCMYSQWTLEYMHWRIGF